MFNRNLVTQISIFGLLVILNFLWYSKLQFIKILNKRLMKVTMLFDFENSETSWDSLFVCRFLKNSIFSPFNSLSIIWYLTAVHLTWLIFHSNGSDSLSVYSIRFLLRIFRLSLEIENSILIKIWFSNLFIVAITAGLNLIDHCTKRIFLGRQNQEPISIIYFGVGGFERCNWKSIRAK